MPGNGRPTKSGFRGARARPGRERLLSRRKLERVVSVGDRPAECRLAVPITTTTRQGEAQENDVTSCGRAGSIMRAEQSH